MIGRRHDIVLLIGSHPTEHVALTTAQKGVIHPCDWLSHQNRPFDWFSTRGARGHHGSKNRHASL